MNARYLLGIALVAAAAVAACGAPEQGSLSSGGDDEGGGTGTQEGTKAPTTKGGGTSGSSTPVPGAPGTPGNLPTNSAAGKDYFAKNVMPVLEAKCGGCHAAGGAGTPTYIIKGDAAKTYESVYAQGFAGATSRIVSKGVHSGGAAPALTGAEIGTWQAWVQVETTTSGGKPTQVNVLEKFGTCFDKAKFDAINFGQLRTTRRQQGNNPQNLNENANNCTGCDNAPCRTCHSADDVTGFVMAIGNPILPPEYTFEETKKSSPAFIQKYVSTTPTGEPQFNPGVKTKSINTIEKAKAYEHPMYKMTPTMDAAIQAFVDDAVAKYKAGTCGK